MQQHSNILNERRKIWKSKRILRRLGDAIKKGRIFPPFFIYDTASSILRAGGSTIKIKRVGRGRFSVAER